MSSLQISTISSQEESGSHNRVPKEAFFLAEGLKVLPLSKSVVKIGRENGNDVVINDQRVSLKHAVLRAMHGNYMIFDLDSSNGVAINGERVHHCILQPGDIVSLGGYALVFGQNDPTIVLS
ncbi:MAG TPA: FHA domain-containing protein [Anaerolineales bacterium]|jgi:pSer/pThr/pTyr-binding forkhead associated (FHA) protein|nr:FHA domain-containing protein [Anaerolineales bacterium]